MEAVVHPQGQLKCRRDSSRFPGAAAVLPLFLFCAAPSNAQDSDSKNEFWPEVNLFVKLNEKSRLFALYTATRPEDLGRYADGQTGLHVDFYGLPPLRLGPIAHNDASRSKSVLLRAGYLFSRPKNNSGSSSEHMVALEATGRFHLRGGFLLSDRNRFDFRWVEGAPRHRYRNRLKLERTFKAGPFDITPYSHVEVFYEFRNTEWTRLRYAAGFEWALTRWFVAEAYLLHQNTWAVVPQFVNAAGICLQFYVR